MTYNFDIPQSNDNLSNSQGQILINFQQLNALMGTNATADHYPWDYTTATSRALHKQITFPTPRGSDPTLTGTQSMFYPKTISGVAQAFFANSTNVFQLTPINNGTLTTDGIFTFAGGLIIQWGLIVSVSDPGLLTFPTPFPNNCFNVSMTVARNSPTLSSMNVNVLTPSTFTYRTNSGGGAGAYWVAIGN